MKLSDKYRPQVLEDIVGQPPVRMLQRIAQEPFSTCLLLEGPRGTGKTSAAYALANELGCEDRILGDLHATCCSELGVDAAKEMLRTLHYRPLSTSGFKVWLMEEMDFLSGQCQTFLKDALEKRLPKHVIVVACSNGTEKIKKPLLDRFTPMFFAGGPCFRKDCEDRLREIWEIETGGIHPFPTKCLEADSDGEFSMRRALDVMQFHLMLLPQVATV